MKFWKRDPLSWWVFKGKKDMNCEYNSRQCDHINKIIKCDFCSGLYCYQHLHTHYTNDIHKGKPCEYRDSTCLNNALYLCSSNERNWLLCDVHKDIFSKTFSKENSAILRLYPEGFKVC